MLFYIYKDRVILRMVHAKLYIFITTDNIIISYIEHTLTEYYAELEVFPIKRIIFQSFQHFTFSSHHDQLVFGNLLKAEIAQPNPIHHFKKCKHSGSSARLKDRYIHYTYFPEIWAAHIWKWKNWAWTENETKIKFIQAQIFGPNTMI